MTCQSNNVLPFFTFDVQVLALLGEFAKLQ